MREWLSQEQLAQFDANNYFEVIGCHSGKRYRICQGNGANIVELDDHARPTTGWCFMPGEHMVAGDVMLAQKIALETNEAGALAAEGDSVEFSEPLAFLFRGLALHPKDDAAVGQGVRQTANP